MTDRAKNTGNGGISDNSFSGPTGVQSGNNNTQINHYAAPSVRPGGAGHRVRIALIVAAALILAGAMGFAAIKFVPGEGSGAQDGRGGKPTDSPTGSSELAPALAPMSSNITPRGEKLCLEVAGNKASSDAVQLWRCNHTDGQKWSPVQERPNIWSLRSFDRCLAATGSINSVGTEVGLKDCATGNVEQQWIVRGNQILNAVSGFCLGSKQVKEGESLRIYHCGDGRVPDWEHHP